MEIEFSIWLASKTRWAHLTKRILMPAVPRVGEFMKFRNGMVGDYFAFKVSQVMYHESGTIDVWTELLDNVEDRMYSFVDEGDLDEYFSSYIDEGWRCERGMRPNSRYRGTSRRDGEGSCD